MSLTIPNGRTASDKHTLTKIEASIAEIFADILKCESVGLQESFFDLGGRSLGTIALLSRIEECYGVKIHLASLIDSPTVQQLAALVANPTASHSGSLVPFQRGGANLPLFCVHGVGGSAAPFAELAGSLGLEQPFYGLQAAETDDGLVRYVRLEDIAAHYITQIREVQPTGPFSVAGWSSGSVVAFEIARQLHAAGEKVAMLALLDTSAPSSVKLHGISHFFHESIARAKRHFGVWSQGDLGQKLWYGVDAVRRRLRLKAVKRSEAAGESVPGDITEALLIAERAYRAKPYEGSAVLFRTASLAAEYPNDPTLGWGKLIQGGVEIRDIPGDHLTIMRAPHVHVLAEQLRATIRVLVGIALSIQLPADRI